MGVSGATSVAGTPNIIIGSSGSGGGSSSGEFEKCAGKISKATLTPVNMFIQFDRSSSMVQLERGVTTGPTKWDQASKALNAFFSDPASDGLKVALRFFPDDKPAPGCTGGTGGACDAKACAQPLVPLGALLAAPGPTDGQEGLLLKAVADSTPIAAGMMGGAMGMGGGTPIFPALQGALDWANVNQMATPGEKTVVVLVTDGEPNGCNTDIEDIASLSSTALSNSMIQTYVIGIQGASETQLNTIARAGGTDHAFFAGETATAQQDLLDALNAIRGSALACQFQVPASDTGVLDPTKINIQFTDGAGMVTKLAKTTGAAACGTADGWYYDDPAMPKSISLCASTCARVQADGGAQLDVQVGCETMIR